MSILLIASGALLSLKESTNEEPYVQAQVEPEVVDNVQYQSLTPSQNNTDKPTSTAENDVDGVKEGDEQLAAKTDKADDATSYDDDLQGPDDEVEEVKPDFDELGNLPQNAQDAVSDILDAADQAMRINDQFSHTVVRGDNLKDVLELSGLEDDTASQLIAAYPELKNLRAGQQFYWILNKEDQLEYLNWLVSEKEERIYERSAEGKFTRQILEKKSIWKKEVLKGQINGSFASALRAQGLDGRQISQLTSALQWQVSLQNYRREVNLPFWYRVNIWAIN
ncbi:peptidase, M23 family [Haemophilus pittmaniae HK 85]|uniref:Peptidase, M23 family n=1 Tax=Haemophilus pittmaniae HK 85 TaxID=1035188 RepID=F9QBA8_9PAST|nr:peptidase, M23 family [Haemophilus pittmaniae HK 85]